MRTRLYRNAQKVGASNYVLWKNEYEEKKTMEERGWGKKLIS